MVKNARDNDIAPTLVELKNMDMNLLEQVISELLYLSPRIVKPLSSITYSKTKGNSLFVSQLLRSMHRDGLLRVDLTSEGLTWKMEQICASKLPDNVALCFANGIEKLPIEVQLALNTLSMFGSSAVIGCVRALETQLGMILIEPLKVAAAEGLATCAEGSYHFNFTHDRIQDTCYNMIRENDRLGNHLIYGQCLAKLAVETNDDDIYFIAVGQINKAGNGAVKDANDYIIMAKHNMFVGKKAIERSDFSLAFNFFVEFLPQQHCKARVFSSSLLRSVQIFAVMKCMNWRSRLHWLLGTERPV
jgi:predicted ATPase